MTLLGPKLGQTGLKSWAPCSGQLRKRVAPWMKDVARESESLRCYSVANGGTETDRLSALRGLRAEIKEKKAAWGPLAKVSRVFEHRAGVCGGGGVGSLPIPLRGAFLEHH